MEDNQTWKEIAINEIQKHNGNGKDFIKTL